MAKSKVNTIENLKYIVYHRKRETGENGKRGTKLQDW